MGHYGHYFSLERIEGYYIVKDVHNRKLGIQPGYLCVILNDFDFRKENDTTLLNLDSKVQNFTNCRSVFLGPNFPEEYLNKKVKVSLKSSKVLNKCP